MRNFATAVGIAATLLCTGASHAQSPASNYPTKPVTLIAPFPPGTTTEFSAREISQIYTESLGRPFLVDFKAGAGGLIGHTYVAKSSPDGYTLLVLGGSFTTLPAFEDRLPYDPIKGFDPISLFTKRSVLLVVTPSSTIKTFPDFLAYAKANPGKINWGTVGAGGALHLGGEWLAHAMGVKFTFVHYKGSSTAEIDLMAGRIQAVPKGMISAIPLMKSGKARVVAILQSQRASALPGIRTAVEMGATDYEYPSWIGIIGAGSTPPAIVNKLSAALTRGLKSPKSMQTWDTLGVMPVGSTPDEFRRILGTEITHWKKFVTENNIKGE